MSLMTEQDKLIAAVETAVSEFQAQGFTLEHLRVDMRQSPENSTAEPAVRCSASHTENGARITRSVPS